MRDKITKVLDDAFGMGKSDYPEDYSNLKEKMVDKVLKAIEDSIGEEFDYGDKLARKALSIEFMGGYNQAIRDIKAKLQKENKA